MKNKNLQKMLKSSIKNENSSLMKMDLDIEFLNEDSLYSLKGGYGTTPAGPAAPSCGTNCGTNCTANGSCSLNIF
jgi:hypothetical protein